MFSPKDSERVRLARIVSSEQGSVQCNAYMNAPITVAGHGLTK